MARARNMQRLTDQLKAEHPGMTIYGIGDAAHKRSPSGHNEDDTPGSKPEQEDPDNKPEHRAIDAMIGKAFTLADAWNTVAALVQLEVNRARLLYVIFYRKIWRRKNGWVEEKYTGSDPHTSHPHVSGNWPDDENTADWTLSTSVSAPTPAGGDMAPGFMIQINGDPTVYVSDLMEYRGLSRWETFLFYRDTLKLPYSVVPDLATLRERAGRYWTEDEVAPPALLTEDQMARIEAAAKAGAASAGGVALADASIPADVLRIVMDEEAISLDELREMANGGARLVHGQVPASITETIPGDQE